MAVNATAVWRVRPSGSNTNGGGYDSAISGAGTDYSQQNSAQASGTHGTTTGTTTFTDLTALAFTAAMVGNAIYITGTGQTTGWYFVTGYTSSSVVTLDRSPGTGTLATWHLGGGWADFWTNTTSTGPSVAGNLVYILGSGTPNPSSYTYDYTISTGFAPVAGVNFANDPGTPGYKAPPDTTGGMPVIKFNSAGYIFLLNQSAGNLNFLGLYFVGASGATAGSAVVSSTLAEYCLLEGCVLDQLSYDIGLGALSSAATFGSIVTIGSEVFSSVAPGGAGSNYALANNANSGGALAVLGCNIHDCVGGGVTVGSTLNGEALLVVSGSSIAKNRLHGIFVNSYYFYQIAGNTIDGNLGNGIDIASGQANTYGAIILNNVISNHTQAGTYGINNVASLSPGDTLFIDYNTYYGNTTDLNNLSYSPHDTYGGANPYVGQSTEGYQLA